MSRTTHALVVALLAASPAAFAQRVRVTPDPQAAPAPTPVAARLPEPAPAPVPAPATPADVALAAERKLDAWLTVEARTALEPVAGQAAANAAVAVALGRLLEQEKKYAESESVLRKAAEAAPADPRVPLQLGETLLRQRRTEDADAAFRRATDLATAAVAAQPTAAQRHLVRGTALSRLRRYDEAMEALGKARELDGGSAATLYQMGATRAFQQRWAEAVDLLTQTLAKEPGTALAYYYRGLAHEKLGRKDLMVLDLDRFVKAAASAPEAERARALLAAASR